MTKTLSQLLVDCCRKPSAAKPKQEMKERTKQMGRTSKQSPSQGEPTGIDKPLQGRVWQGPGGGDAHL